MPLMMKMSETTFVHGEAVDLGVFYASFLCSIQLFKPIVDNHNAEQEAFDHIIQQLKSVRIEPIQKDDDHADQ